MNQIRNIAKTIQREPNPGKREEMRDVLRYYEHRLEALNQPFEPTEAELQEKYLIKGEKEGVSIESP